MTGDDYMSGYYGYDLSWTPDPNTGELKPVARQRVYRPDEDLVDGPVKRKVSKEPIIKAPEPPKIKEFNKKLIVTEIEKTRVALSIVAQRITTIKDLMGQEDADDIYGVLDIDKEILSLSHRWVDLKECLNKELELSLPTSKPQG